jgi:hypothetical protein
VIETARPTLVGCPAVGRKPQSVRCVAGPVTETRSLPVVARKPEPPRRGKVRMTRRRVDLRVGACASPLDFLSQSPLPSVTFAVRCAWSDSGPETSSGELPTVASGLPTANETSLAWPWRCRRVRPPEEGRIAGCDRSHSHSGSWPHTHANVRGVGAVRQVLC